MNQFTATGQLKKNFGLRLAFLRKRANLKQDALADILGVSKETVSRIERGYSGTSFDNLEILAQALGVKEWQLFKFEDDDS